MSSTEIKNPARNVGTRVMPKISPPPWTFDPGNHVIYDRRHRYPIITLQECLWWRENGVLAAAAPDLQAALRELVARIEFLDDEGNDGHSYQWIGPRLEPELTGARAALARSEGKP